MLYNDDPNDDLIFVLDFIDSFTQELGIEKVLVNSKECMAAVIGARSNFPYVKGVENASVFKKVANFVAYFIAYGPIKSRFPESAVNVLHKYNPNAVVAFAIAVYCLEKSTICKGNGDEVKVLYPLSVSNHSYEDILLALSTDIKPETHFHLLSVFFEQLTYKTNRQCEYSSPRKYYPELIEDDE